MISIEVSFLFLIVKIFIFILLLKIKNIVLIFNSLAPWLYYNIFTDFVIILDNTPIYERPFWYSMFIATGMVCYAIRTYSIIKMCVVLFVSECYKKVFYILNKLILPLLIIGLWYMILYFYQICKYSSFQERIPTALFSRSGFYLMKFAFIYQLIIILIVFYFVFKSFYYKKVPGVLDEVLKSFFYFGIIPQVFIENIQTSTFQFIAFLFGQRDMPYYSLLTTQITGSLSLYFFLIILITLRRISSILTSKKNLLTNEFYIKNLHNTEQHNKPVPSLFLDDSIFDNIDDIEYPIHYVLVTSVKSTLSKLLLMPTGSIHVELNEITMMFLKQINDISALNSYLRVHRYIILDDLEAYLFFHYDDMYMQNIYHIMNQLNLRVVIPWHYNENDEMYVGALIIEKGELPYDVVINNEVFLKLLAITAYVKKIQRTIQQHSAQNLIVFKISLLHEYLNRVKKLQKETIKNVLVIMQKISMGMYIKNKKKEMWINGMIAEKKMVRDFYEGKKKEITLKEKDYHNTLILQNINDGKKDFTFYATIPLKESLKDSTHDEIMLQFSETGRILNDVMPGYIHELVIHKNDILEYIRNPQPYLFINNNEQSIYNMFLIIAMISKKKLIYCDCNDKAISPSAFIKDHLYNQYNKIIVFSNIHMTNNFEQKNIIKLYMENQKNDVLFTNKIFFVTNYQENIAILDEILLQIIISKEFNPPLLLIFENNTEAIIELIHALSLHLKGMTFARDIMDNLINNIHPWQSIYLLVDFIMKYNSNNESLHEEVLYLEKNSIDMIPERNVDMLIKEAILLGRKSLKNKSIMNLLKKKYNMSEIANMLGVHKSTITRYYKSNDIEKIND